MRCKEKYRLELHWDSLQYHNDSVAVLQGARFTGPVLNDAAKLESPDFIDLDLTPQLLTVMGSYYIVKLSWADVEYSDGFILLKEATLTNDYLKSLHKIGDQDFILINTEKHEEELHPYNLVYESQVMKPDKTPLEY